MYSSPLIILHYTKSQWTTSYKYEKALTYFNALMGHFERNISTFWKSFLQEFPSYAPPCSAIFRHMTRVWPNARTRPFFRHVVIERIDCTTEQIQLRRGDQINDFFFSGCKYDRSMDTIEKILAFFRSTPSPCHLQKFSWMLSKVLSSP